MRSYLKVHVEGCHPGCDADLYSLLDPDRGYSLDELEEIGQDLVNERHSWGVEVVDEDEVPEGDRG